MFSLLDGFFITLFGVPAPVIGMAAAGALFSNAYRDETVPRRKRKQLYAWIAATTFISSVSVAVVPPMFGMEWVLPSLQAPLAGFIGFMSQWFLPKLIEAFPDIIRKIFRIEPTYGGGYYGRHDRQDQDQRDDYYEDR